LPGVGPSTADQIIATLRKKVTKFALIPEGKDGTEPTQSKPGMDGNLVEDAYRALLTVGHSPMDARNLLDKALGGGKSFKSVEDILLEIYKQRS
jgi:Holliday junction DNA helicase RuvA